VQVHSWLLSSSTTTTTTTTTTSTVKCHSPEEEISWKKKNKEELNIDLSIVNRSDQVFLSKNEKRFA
jgi:hypothetical protein